MTFPFYDAELFDAVSPGIPGDIAFYIDACREASGPVLELGCGTGRVLSRLVEAGIEAWGLDRSEEMLTLARQRVGPDRIFQGDMSDFSLERRFALIVIPYRAFQHLLSPLRQQRCLRAARRHLAPGGRLIVDLVDPRLELLAPYPGDGLGRPVRRMKSFRHPRSGHQVVVLTTRRIYLERQILREEWIFEEVDAEGHSLSRRFRTLTLRYSFRYEMEHLFRLCGYRVLHLWGDFDKSPFRAGREQIWVAEPRRVT